MNSEPSSNHQPPSSQAGRKWLQNADVLASQNSGDSESQYVPIVVSVPDVGFDAGLPFGSANIASANSTSSGEIESALTEATEARLDEIGQAFDKQLSMARSDLSEQPTEWTDNPEKRETGRRGTKPSGQPSQKPEQNSPSSIQDATQNEAMEPLVNAILDRFPLAEPVVLLFVGSEANAHIDETTARISKLLAERNVGRVLLIDSDIAGHHLSLASGLSGEPGISDVVNQQVDWKPLVYGGSTNGLDFFPCGGGKFSHPDGSTRLRSAVVKMKQEYQFICVSAGDAHSPWAKIWTDFCDGSYLLVSMKNSNETFAKSAVTELQSCGARLLGCVVTDVS